MANPTPTSAAQSASALVITYSDGSLVEVPIVALSDTTGHVVSPGGGGGAGGAVTVIDGGDVAQGATTDAAITTNAVGTLSGKLRGLVAIFADIWDSVNHRMRVDGSGVTQPVSIAATVTIRPAQPSTGALTNVASAIASGTLLAANAARLGATIFNDSTANLFVKFGTTASATSFTVKIAAGGYYELPQPVYTGRIDGIWDVANGNARVTEET